MTGDWTVYQRLVAREPAETVDRGEPVATDGGAPVDEPETCAQCGREGVEGYVCELCAAAADDRRDDDIAGSERADFGGGEGGVDSL